MLDVGVQEGLAPVVQVDGDVPGDARDEDVVDPEEAELLGNLGGNS